MTVCYIYVYIVFCPYLCTLPYNLGIGGTVGVLHVENDVEGARLGNGNVVVASLNELVERAAEIHTAPATVLIFKFDGLAGFELHVLGFPSLVGGIPCHGDACTPLVGVAYYDNLKNLITFLRKEVYKVTGDEADLTLPFIMGTVPHRSRQFNSQVEAAQLKLAKDMSNVYVLDLSDAGLRSDNLHFNAAWTEYFGMRVYNKLVEIGAVEGRGIEIVKPDEDVVTERTDLNPVKAWNYASGKCSKESMQQLKANGNYNERHGYRNNQRRGIHPSRSLQRWKV